MISLALALPLLAASAVRAVDHPVAVGGPGMLVFTPSTVKADPGDTVTFVFHEKNHTATQAAFSSPCSPLEGGFNSGFMPVPAGTTDNFPSYSITVNDTKPIWAYCAQPGPPAHCAAGMVFAVNAPDTGNTFDAFKAAAMASAGGSASATATASASTAWTSPPAPVVSSVTATVTWANSVYTTTYASWEGASPNPTPAAQPAVHTVVVGGTAGLVYTPSTVVAAIGDVIQFQFQAKNHTATQALFSSPCSSVAKSSNGTKSGFDSGFMPVAPNATEFPTYNVTVNDTAPIWVYCRQQGPPVHCQQGMVFAVNAPESGPNTFLAFQQLAEHTNVTNSSSSSSGNTTSGGGDSGSGSKGNGAGRAAVSVGMGVGVMGVVVAALL